MAAERRRSPSDSVLTAADGSNQAEQDGSDFQQRKRARTRSGCLNCRRRRRKCDENHPSCQNCLHRADKCEWATPFTFKEDNLQILSADHPSMRQCLGSGNRISRFEILDVTRDIIHEYNEAESPAESTIQLQDAEHETAPSFLSPASSTSQPPSLSSQHVTASSSHLPNTEDFIALCVDPALTGHGTAGPYVSSGSHDTPNGEYHSQHTLSPNSSVHTTGVSPGTHHHSGNIPNPTHFGRNTYPNTDEAAAELLALRYPSATLPIAGGDVFSPLIDPRLELTSDPFTYDSSDGIFLPGSTYLDLHTTLRNHIIGAARSDFRHTLIPDGTAWQDQPRFADKHRFNDDLADLRETHTETPPSVTLTKTEEYSLWKNYLSEVGPWLDMFDNSHHFTHRVSILAESVPHLKYSILALSARQMERKASGPPSGSSGSSLGSRIGDKEGHGVGDGNGNGETGRSLALYQKAIHLLLPCLHGRDSAVIASCVILCVLEMMSCNPKEWRRHLDGCAVLLEAISTSTSDLSGPPASELAGEAASLHHALFWCYARMDLCGSLISQESTIIPISSWGHHGGLTGTNRLFRNADRKWDMYANHAVFLAAHVVNFLFGPSHGASRKPSFDREGIGEHVDRWRELHDEVEHWYKGRPEELLPILVIPANQKKGEGAKASPFPTLLYRTGAAVSSNQLYHTAALLLLQAKPKDLTLNSNHPGGGGGKTKTILFHARQICGISQSNDHHSGSWVNALQPLWTAGKVMSHTSEHQAIIEILKTIERETGWGTGWRVDDLREYWGDEEE